MDWLEADPLPVVCQNCQEEECYNCDHAGERWYLSQEDEDQLRRKLMQKAAERFERQARAGRGTSSQDR